MPAGSGNPSGYTHSLCPSRYSGSHIQGRSRTSSRSKPGYSWSSALLTPARYNSASRAQRVATLRWWDTVDPLNPSKRDSASKHNFNHQSSWFCFYAILFGRSSVVLQEENVSQFKLFKQLNLFSYKVFVKYSRFNLLWRKFFTVLATAFCKTLCEISVFKTNWNVLALFVATHHIHFCTVTPIIFFFFFFFSPLNLDLNSNIDFAIDNLDWEIKKPIKLQSISFSFIWDLF